MISQNEIFDFLNRQNNDLIKYSDIANHFGVTKKTMLTYLDDIKDNFSENIEINSNGIIVMEKFGFEDKNIPFTIEERKSYILRTLLTKTEYLNIDALALELCISEVTLTNEIKKARKDLAHLNLTLKTKNNNIYLCGEQKDKQKLLIEMIYAEAQNSMVSLKNLKEIFPRYDIENIRNRIISYLDDSHLFIDEYSLINLILHILIAMNQSQSFSIPRSDEKLDFNCLDKNCFEIINKICREISNIYEISFTRNNYFQFTVLLMTRTKKNQEYSKETVFDQNPINDEAGLLVNEIVSGILETYNIDLNVPEFKIAFGLHLENLMVRLSENVIVRNPLLYNIKATSPLIYDISFYISNLICKTKDVTISDDEIAYIALHIGTRIEELNSKNNKLKTIIVCPHYYTYNHSHFNKLELYFHDQLTIESIITNPSDLKSEEFDIVISTIPLLNNKNYVMISNFFNQNDKDDIHKFIKKYRKNKSESRILETLNNLINCNVFDADARYKSKDEAIDIMGHKIVKGGYATAEFINKIIEREEISPTNFGMIAIPHPIDYYTNKTVISVSILKKPINWGNTSVKIIFMISISKRDFL